MSDQERLKQCQATIEVFTAYFSGRRAFKEGIKDNPTDVKNSEAHKAWIDGWEEEKEIAERDELLRICSTLIQALQELSNHTQK